MNKRGFTLIEVIIVIAIFTIIVAFAAPSVQKWRRNAAIKGVAYDIMSGLRKARSTAISNGSIVTVTISPNNHQLVIGTQVITLSEEVDFQVNGDNSFGDSDDFADVPLNFYPQGTCDSALYVRVNYDDNLLVKIESRTTALSRL